MKGTKTLALAVAGILAGWATPQVAAQADTGQYLSAAETYIVRFVEPGAMYYSGGIENLAATSRETTGARFEGRSSEAVAYRDHLLELHAQRQGAIASTLGRTVEVKHNYHVMYSGIAIDLTFDEAARVRGLPGVVSVQAAGVFELATDAGPTLIGAAEVWSGAAMPNNAPNRGEGVVIGVLDGGANSSHPSYANDASCGFDAITPKQLSAVDCLSPNCVGGNPEDITTIGHGVHTASTAAGNRLVPPLTVGGVNLRWEISGVAPCGQIRHYKVCGSSTCSGDAIQAAIQAAIVDQVDVVNYSISGGTSPWNDSDRGFLDMVNSDIFVVASAGNTNATVTNPVGAVNHRGPWVMSVANSTHDRIEGNRINVTLDGPQGVPSQSSASPFPVTTTAQAVTSLSLGNELGCNPGFAAGSMTGKLAVIRRGTCNFTEKAINAQNAGAIGVIVYNAVGGPPISMPALAIPGVMVGDVAGVELRDFLDANSTADVTVTVPVERITDPSFADVLAGSSLRGPNNSFDVTKPDITAPGTNIYAAVSVAGGQFGFLSGTSMSGPHVAGAGMLVRAAEPGWTPQEVKSALQLTASRDDGLKDTGLTNWDPDDVGNGRVRVNLAVQSGLVMNETFANFLAANPATGGQPRNLNLPSIRHTSCPGNCTFTRTFRNTQTTPVTWNAVLDAVPAGTAVQVTPSSFSFTGDTSETQTISIKVLITAPLPDGLPNLSFGYLTFRDAAGNLPDASVSLAVRGSSNDRVFINGFEN